MHSLIADASPIIVSQMIDNIDIAAVSELLGHASVSTTFYYYIQAIKEYRAKTASCMAELMYIRSRKRKNDCA
jgi:integrase